ncbi:ATP-binding protein [Fodinisporobacter ferrooxydans]|uniref:histidine kinase n=1 Tax=Fodinisporobacter ferrooxydans TaxID=2901836 RepID=A0ABY4CHE8_9BACL|nr:ATP-binding protein [Alicyclobacillaceae bacterium MYW30-H2]
MKLLREERELLQQKESSQEAQNNTLNRLAAIGQLSAGIAHEVRNPLTSVKGFLQLLHKESPHTYTEIALAELDRAIDTLQNLLQVSKPDQDTEPFREFCLYSEIESILYLFQDKLYTVSVKQTFENPDVTIYGKRNQLKKAFFNLLKNSFEAIPEKGEVEIRQYVVGKFLYLMIRDTGVGIPDEKMRLLGTPFFTTKTEGTGMGLAQVFSAIYQHGASIDVESEVGVGTTFLIKFPIVKDKRLGVTKLELVQTESDRFLDFYKVNHQAFLHALMQEAEQTFRMVKENQIQSIDLLQTMDSLVTALDEGQYHVLVLLSQEHGVEWAKSGLSLSLKLEWLQAFRKVYWDFLYNFHKNHELTTEEFFELERKTNYTIDAFVHHFTANYTKYKDEVLQSQQEIIEELTVPLIPMSAKIAVLPLVGTLDTYRAKRIQERVLHRISSLNLSRVIIDLSGVPFMDTAVVSHLFRIIDGITLLGCKAIITGIRPEIVNTMIELGIEMPAKVVTLGSLQQALEQFGLN